MQDHGPLDAAYDSEESDDDEEAVEQAGEDDEADLPDAGESDDEDETIAPLPPQRSRRLAVVYNASVW